MPPKVPASGKEPTPTQNQAAVGHRKIPRWLIRFAAVAGPGIVVMLADTDAGSVITAAQSGAQWGYRLLSLQVILIPILYIIQELTVRIGVVTQQGHGAGIRKHFGPVWAWISISTLLVACVGALITELSGIAGVGALLHIPVWESMAIVILGLTVMALTGSYKTVERIAIAVGLLEIVFLGVAYVAQPAYGTLISDSLSKIPFHNSEYQYMVAANIGAVIMPWMVFYQQSSVVEKGLTTADLPAARWDTAIGAVVTQLIMGAVLIATAATIGQAHDKHSLDTVQEISQSLTTFLGHRAGTTLFALGMIGASVVATIVVTLTAARSLGEVMGYSHSLKHRPQDAPWFYGVFFATLVLGGAVVMSGANLVKLSVGVQVMNAILLPIVLGFLVALARKALPPPYRLKGIPYALVVTTVVITATLGLGAGILGIFQ